MCGGVDFPYVHTLLRDEWKCNVFSKVKLNVRWGLDVRSDVHLQKRCG